jgi:thiamine pyrophosphate-dependent acetolactate synthase large subunit-like protein
MTEMGWGSDAVAAVVRDLGFEYVALVPGSSFRGLHDSFVNFLNDEKPKMLVCLHEEHTVAIAHGYAKVTGKPMAVAIHSNVGLMHATMAFYDAWCDRAPVLVLGATGPIDAEKRRPWIDWIHTARDQASMVRPYTKWDDTPGSVKAAMDSVVRATQLACTAPMGPAYVVLDVELQEQKLSAPLALPEKARFGTPIVPVPSAADVERAVKIMKNAKRPVILLGRTSRDEGAWNDRIALAEALNARVVTDLKVAAQFPSEHPLHVGRPATRPGKEQAQALREADAILSLEAVDLGGTLKLVFGDERCPATIIAASIDRYVHNGWSMDHQMMPPVDMDMAVSHEKLVSGMLDVLGRPKPSVRAGESVKKPAAPAATNGKSDDAKTLGISAFCARLEEAFGELDKTYIRLPLGAGGGTKFEFRHPLDYLGGDGGGGVGAGPGLSVGAALALRGTGRLPVAVLGDGDFMMGLTAIWTAVAYKIPLLVVICNNRSYYNDIVHQERMAVVRDRPVERKWIGQTIDQPPPDMAMLARGQGAVGIGPIEGGPAMQKALQEAIASVRAGNVCVVDVLVAPEYDNPTGVLGSHAVPARA